jgi:hypothetical protein
MKTPASSHTLMPKGFNNAWASVNSMPPQQLVIGSPEETSPDMTPHFSAKLDNSITWDDMGWCVEASGRASGDAVRVNVCNSGAAQKWNWIPDGHGRNKIQLQDSNLCLDAQGGGLNEASIELRECANTESWKFGESLLLPTQAQAPYSGMRQVLASLLALAGIGVLSLRAWVRRSQAKASHDDLSVVALEHDDVDDLSLAALEHGMMICRCGDIEAPPAPAAARCPAPVMGWFGGGAPKKDPFEGMSARDLDFARRQDKLAARRDKAASAPKGQVEVTFPQKGNKTVTAMQGEPLAKVIQKAGMRVKYDCKNGRCATCQVRLNGRSAVKVCQGATVPGGATRKLKVTLDNP